MYWDKIIQCPWGKPTWDSACHHPAQHTTSSSAVCVAHHLTCSVFWEYFSSVLPLSSLCSPFALEWPWSQASPSSAPWSRHAHVWLSVPHKHCSCAYSSAYTSRIASLLWPHTCCMFLVEFSGPQYLTCTSNLQEKLVLGDKMAGY